MTRMTAKDFDQGLLDLYDFYVHGKITKREFLDRASKFAVGGVTAMALLDMLKPNYALAEQVSFNDPDIKAEYTTYSSPNGTGDVRGVSGQATGKEGKLPAVLSFTRTGASILTSRTWRVASPRPAFIALAPDGLTSVGGYPGNDEDGKALQKTVDRVALMNDFFAGYEHLVGRDDRREGRLRRLLLWRWRLQRPGRGLPRS